jgi:hypothetical protein
MIYANPVTPEWVKVVLRTVGMINAAALLLGTSFLVDSAYRLLTGHIIEPHDAPYFRVAFAVMSLIELVFASILLLTAIRFIQAKLSAVNLYSLAVLLLVVYFAVITMLWQGHREIALSVASATAGSNATSVFEFLFLIPFLYPLLSVILVQLLKRRYGSGGAAISA